MARTRVRGRRAFSIGSVLSRSFTILGRNIVPFTIMAVVVYLPLMVFLAIPETETDSAPEAFASEYDPYEYGAEESRKPDLVRLLVTLGLVIVLPYIVTGALIYGVMKQLRGETAPMADCLRVGFTRLIPILVVGTLAGLASALGLVVLIIPGVILTCMFWVAVPVAVIERPGVIASLRRSAQLTSGEKGSIFVLLLVLGGSQFACQKIGEQLLPASTAGALLSLIPTIFFAMLAAVASAVGYHDLRVAKEGVGIEQLVSVFA